MPSPLAWVYSQIDRGKRYLNDAISDPVGYISKGVGQIQDSAREQDGALAQAFANTNRPFQVTDQAALAQAVNSAMAGASFAPAGVTAWHGSPHVFDKFNSSKIGTGEGAQAYGYGLYLAESPEVAKGYKAKLNDAPISSVKADLYDIAGDPQWSIKAFDGNGQVIPKVNGYLAPDEIEKHYGKEVADLVLGSKYGGHFKNLNVQEGALYKVDLPDGVVAKMLDWDKPLSQQPAAENLFRQMHEASGGQGYTHPDGYAALGVGSTDQLKGSDLYQMLREKAAPGSDVPDAPLWLKQQAGDAAERLRQAGIPGVKYLDGGSRNAGEGTSNFVVFPGNDDLLTILERNGIPLSP